jgi:hypothetical protein
VKYTAGMSVAEIIDDLGGTTAVAEAVGVAAPVVSNWRARDRIPADRWAALVELAKDKGKGKAISFEKLAALAAEARV